MTSLYSAPLNTRLKYYYKDTAEKQININNDYIINQQLLFDERMQTNSFNIFENQKKITEKLYLENSKMLALPASEKTKTLAIENPEILAIENPEIFVLPARIALETQQEGGTPKTLTPERMTPISQLAKDSQLRIKLKNYPLYKEFRQLSRAKRGGLPTQDDMREFANSNNIILPEKASSSVLADAIIRGIDNIKTMKGEGFKKFIKKNKYKKY